MPGGRKKRKLSDRGPGRPTEYRSEMCEDVREWVSDGIFEYEIAARLGIHPSTLCDWKNEFPEFSEAFKVGLKRRHHNVKNALYQKCIGFEYTETTREPALVKKTIDGQNETILQDKKMVITKKVKKFVPPSDNAIEFYLTNTCPDEYKHKTEVHSKITGDINVKKEVDLSNLSDEELDKLEEIISKASNS
jgi:hypothetical protein